MKIIFVKSSANFIKNYSEYIDFLKFHKTLQGTKISTCDKSN